MITTKISKTFIISIGISGSGKSTWMKDKHPVVSPDILRKYLLGDVNEISNPDFISRVAKASLIELFKRYDTVYYDDDFVDKWKRLPLLIWLKEKSETMEWSMTYKAVIFDCEPPEAFKRIQNDLKEKKERVNVPLSCIEDQYKKYLYTRSRIVMEKDRFFNNDNVDIIT